MRRASVKVLPGGETEDDPGTKDEAAVQDGEVENMEMEGDQSPAGLEEQHQEDKHHVGGAQPDQPEQPEEEAVVEEVLSSSSQGDVEDATVSGVSSTGGWEEQQDSVETVFYCGVHHSPNSKAGQLVKNQREGAERLEALREQIESRVQLVMAQRERLKEGHALNLDQILEELAADLPCDSGDAFS
ncbi:unnamed protein product [Chrysoparadoxa australica]